MAIFTKEKTYNILDLGFNRLLIKPSSEDSFITPEMVNAWRSGVAAKSLLSGQIISTLEQQTGVLFNGKTDFSNTDSGYRLGVDTDLVLKFYIGDSSNYLNWTGSALDISGAFSAGSIDIGGSDASSFHVDSDGNMWLGAATFASAPFQVSNIGVVTVSTLQTGTSGQRVEIVSSTLSTYDANGDKRIEFLDGSQVNVRGTLQSAITTLAPAILQLTFSSGGAQDVLECFGSYLRISVNGTNNYDFYASGATGLSMGGNITNISHLLPSGAGAGNVGNATNYWNDVSYKTLTDRGCLFDADDGVELQDGRIVSDVEAIKAIKKHPTKLSVHGLAALDYKTFPKKIYKPADKDGEILPRDKDDIPYWYEEVEDEKTKEIKKVKRIAADGVETTGVISILLGAIKELSNRIDFLEKKIT